MSRQRPTLVYYRARKKDDSRKLFIQHTTVRIYLQNDQGLFKTGVARRRSAISWLCADAETLRCLGIHLRLALAGEFAAATGVGLDDTESFKLLQSVSDEAAGRL